MDVFGIAASGMQAAQAQLNATANNIANLNTPNFQPQRVNLVDVATGGVVVSGMEEWNQPVDPIAEIIQLRESSYLYDFNGMTVNVSNQQYGSLLNILDTQDPKAGWNST